MGTLEVIKDIQEGYKLSDLIYNYSKSDSIVEQIDPGNLLLDMLANISKDTVRLIAAYNDDDNPVGFIFAYMLTNYGKDFVYVLHIYSEGNNNVGLGLFSAIEDWTRSLGINKIRGIISSENKRVLDLFNMYIEGLFIYKELN